MISKKRRENDKQNVNYHIPNAAVSQISKSAFSNMLKFVSVSAL